MTDDITIVRLEDKDRWITEHRDGGLPSQSWHYAWGLSATGLYPKLAVVRCAGARMLMPFVERGWKEHIDIATILGMSGASISSDSAAPLALWREYATAQGWVAGYIQLSISTDLTSVPEDRVTTNNISFILDIRGANILQSASRTIRRKIYYAAHQDAVLVDDRSRRADQLLRLYPLTMRRVKAPRHYRFPQETLCRWAYDPATLLLGAAIEGSIEAVYAFRIAGNYAETHINASNDRSRHLAPWLIWNGISRLQKSGVEWLDLGATAQTGDGLYRFKEKFGGLAKPVQAVHQIYNRRIYDELCRNAGVAPAARWFPAYRSIGVEDTAEA